MSRSDATDGDGDAPAGSGRAKGNDEDALDLEDLERVGVDGVVAQLRAQSGGDDGQVSVPKRRRARARSPVLSVFVSLFGIYLLITMFSDFRYWIRSSQPRDLGDAGALAEGGKMPGGLHDQHVRLLGTPDVQRELRASTRQGNRVDYMRIIEGGGSLFVALRRTEGENIGLAFEHTFVGRMKRLGDHPAAQGLAQLLADEEIVHVRDTTLPAIFEALADNSGAKTIATADGSMTLTPDAKIRLGIEPPEARVQLGVESFANAAAAEAAVAALGYPWIRAPGKPHSFYSFVARIPPGERAAAESRLNAGLELPDAADSKYGAAVLAARSGVRVAAGQLGREDDALVVPVTADDPAPIYDVVDGKLVAREGAGASRRIPLEWIREVRIETPIHFDPNGYLLLVGEVPSDQRVMGLAWLVVATLVGLNLVSLAAWLRRRGAVRDAA